MASSKSRTADDAAEAWDLREKPMATGAPGSSHPRFSQGQRGGPLYVPATEPGEQLGS